MGFVPTHLGDLQLGKAGAGAVAPFPGFMRGLSQPARKTFLWGDQGIEASRCFSLSLLQEKERWGQETASLSTPSLPKPITSL